MRILYLAPMRVPGEKAHSFQAVKMSEALASLGNSVVFYHWNYRKKESDSSIASFYGLKHQNNLAFRQFNAPFAPSNIVLYHIQVFLYFISAIRRFRFSDFDLIVTRNSEFLLFLTSFFLPKNTKLVHEFHTVPKSGAKKFFISHSRPSLAVAISKPIFLWLGSLGFDCALLPDAADVNSISAASPKESLVSEPWKKVGYFGKIDLEGHYSWKGVDTLVEAFTYKEPPKNTKLYLFGQISDEDQKTIIRKLGKKVKIMGYVQPKEVASYMRSMDLLVIPNTGKSKISSEYTSPLKFFEYLASGKPIVASNLPSIRGGVSHSGVYFFNPDDPEDLALKIAEAINGPREFKRSVYSWEKRAEELLSFVA
ncbi:glycosyltransferase [Candidatus Micrarchaeota archaeon]|nr:glycosyltransferase [Candidatus Micrarchaeota archaeon]